MFVCAGLPKIKHYSRCFWDHHISMRMLSFLWTYETLDGLWRIAGPSAKPVFVFLPNRHFLSDSISLFFSWKSTLFLVFCSSCTNLNGSFGDPWSNGPYDPSTTFTFLIFVYSHLVLCPNNAINAKMLKCRSNVTKVVLRLLWVVTCWKMINGYNGDKMTIK